MSKMNKKSNYSNSALKQARNVFKVLTCVEKSNQNWNQKKTCNAIVRGGQSPARGSKPACQSPEY